MTPILVLDASVSKTKGREKFDKNSTGVIVMASSNSQRQVELLKSTQSGLLSTMRTKVLP